MDNSAREVIYPYGHQSISEDDIEAVAEVLRSGWLTQGPAVGEFERTVADYAGAVMPWRSRTEPPRSTERCTPPA